MKDGYITSILGSYNTVLNAVISQMSYACPTRQADDLIREAREKMRNLTKRANELLR